MSVCVTELWAAACPCPPTDFRHGRILELAKDPSGKNVLHGYELLCIEWWREHEIGMPLRTVCPATQSITRSR
jgi:hypothetical protein